MNTTLHKLSEVAANMGAHWSDDPADPEPIRRIKWLTRQVNATPPAPAAAIPAPNDMRDAYLGAREDLLDWKKRALEAEELVRKFTREVNGPTFMGEPADAIPAVSVGPDNDEEIEPADCPKCGGSAFLDSWYREDSACMVRVRCSACPHHGPTEFGAASEGDRTTIKAWNDAALATPSPAVSVEPVARVYIEDNEMLERSTSIPDGTYALTPSQALAQPQPGTTEGGA